MVPTEFRVEWRPAGGVTSAGIAFSGGFLYLLRVSFKVLEDSSGRPTGRGHPKLIRRSIVREV